MREKSQQERQHAIIGVWEDFREQHHGSPKKNNQSSKFNPLQLALSHYYGPLSIFAYSLVDSNFPDSGECQFSSFNM